MEGTRVLVIDDDATIRLLIRRLVEHAGGELVEAPSGQDGLRALFDVRPTSSCSIWHAGPRRLETLERIRQITDVPVVMLRAHAASSRRSARCRPAPTTT